MATASDLAVVIELRDKKAVEINEEEKSVFLVEVKKCFERGEAHTINTIISDPRYEGLAESSGWDLVPLVCSHLGNRADGVDKDCSMVLQKLAELSSPREMLISLLEQVDKFLNESLFKEFLDPIQTVLLQLKSAHRHLSFNLTLSTLYYHIKSLPLPDMNNLNPLEKRMLNIQDGGLQVMEETLLALLDFLTPFIYQIHRSIASQENPDDETEKLREEITRFLIKLLEYPLVKLELNLPSFENEEKKVVTKPQKSIFRSSAEQIMCYLAEMRCSYTSLMQYTNLRLGTQEKVSKKGQVKAEDDGIDNSTSNTSDDDPSNLEEETSNEEDLLSPMGLSCFSYLVLVEEVNDRYLPYVFSPLYLLNLNVEQIITLLSTKEDNILHKGLELFLTLVNCIPDHSLMHHLIQEKSYSNLPSRVIDVLVQCPTESIRKSALHCLKIYIEKFYEKGKYVLLQQLLSQAYHSGVAGFLIGIIKEEVSKAFLAKQPSWFLGSHLIAMYKIVYTLQLGAETDLLQDSDRVMAALNFLRYLLLKDPQAEDVSGIWHELPSIETNFLTPLRTAINLSRAHYQQRLKEIQEEIKEARRANLEPRSKISLTVAGNTLPPLPYDNQKEIIAAAHSTFDLIESILCRVNEIIDSL